MTLSWQLVLGVMSFIFLGGLTWLFQVKRSSGVIYDLKRKLLKNRVEKNIETLDLSKLVDYVNERNKRESDSRSIRRDSRKR